MRERCAWTAARCISARRPTPSGRGIGFCPEDRKTDGIIPDMSVRENLTLALLPGLSRAASWRVTSSRPSSISFIKRLGIKTAGPDQKIRELSGGNQQKVLLARWLCLNPRLLILDEPTRGIDVGAKGEIQALINELADAGLGVLMISSETRRIDRRLRPGGGIARRPDRGRTAARRASPSKRSWPRWRMAPKGRPRMEAPVRG